MNRRHVIILLAVCLGLRLFFFFLVQPWQPDVRDTIIVRSEAYLFHHLALGIKDRGEFGYEDGRLEALRMPGQPAFLAATYTIFGERPWVALLLQILIEGCTCVLLYRIIVPRLGANAAFGAAILYAADPLLIRLSSSLLTDLLFTFLLVAAFYVLSRTIAREEERGKVVRFAIAGLLLGLAALTRPVAQYAPFVLLIFFVLLYKPDWKRAIKYSAAVGVAFMLTITPWIVRNQQAFGRAELSTSGPYGLLVLHIFPMVKGKHPQLSHSEMKDQLLAEADSLMARDGGDPATANPFEKSDYWTKVGLKYVKEDPVGFAWSYVVGLYSLFMVIGAQAFLNMLDHPAGWLRYLIAAIIAGHLFVTYGSALLGLVVGWRRHDRAFLWLALGLALYFIILTGPAGISRYRVPAIPFYLVFSGIGLAYLWDKAVAKRRS